MIIDEYLYNLGKKRRIMENAKIGRFNRMMATDLGKEAHDILVGERWMKNNFAMKMREVLHNYGGLTEKQAATVVRIYNETEAKRDERKAARLAEDALSQHIGEVGRRIEMTLEVRKIIAIDGYYGTVNINLCKCGCDVVVYKGSNRLDVYGDGHTVTVKATIKAHEVREGIKQTIISRPTVQ
ncbi:MAG: hypothetical protein ACO20X_13290 [Alphaproteobacteria bacterium]